jgi:uncharacterized damage-inducible protein DinB
MTYYGAKNLADSFRTVRKNTLTIASEIPEEQYGFRAADGTMSAGELLAHIAVSPMWQIEVHGQKIAQVDFAFFGSRLEMGKQAEAALRTKAEIIRALTENGEQFAAFVEKLDEGTLSETVTFPPPVQPAAKSRFEMLLGPKEHEMHHRGQLMLIQRLLGQVPELTRRRGAAMAARTAQPARA